MISSVSTNVTAPTADRSYELKSELLKSTLPRNQKSEGMFMTWLNTLCAVYLGVGILGAKNPNLFVPRLAVPEDRSPIIEIPPEPEKPPEKEKIPIEPLEEPTVLEKIDQLPVVVPIPVLDLKDVSFARPVEGLVTVDPKKLGTYDRPKPNLGIAGTEAKPGNPQAKPAVVGQGGRRRFTDDDVDRGSTPLPKPNVVKYGRVEIEPGTVIRIAFGSDGSVIDVQISPSLSNSLFEKELRAHVRKNWHSKIGAIAGDWPLNQKD